MYESNEFGVALYYYAFADERHIIEFVLYFLRIDVLSVGSEEHVLDTSFYVYVSAWCHCGEVAGVKPSVFVEHGVCGFLVLVVAEHHVHALGDEFAWHVGRVGAYNLRLHVVNNWSARRYFVFVVVGKGDERSCLGGAVADGDGHSHAVEEFLDALIKRCSTYDYLECVASECLHYTVAYVLLYLLVDDGHVQEQLHAVGLHLSQHLTAYYLLNNERYSHDESGLHLSKRLGDERRRRHTVEEVQVASVDESEEEFDCQSVHVSHWQNAYQI